MKNWILVFLGGGIGSMARYACFVCMSSFNNSFPLATFIINILGSFIIGILIALGNKYQSFTNTYNVLLSIGFCGGFTTFSAYSKELFLLLKQQQFFIAFAYALFSIIMCVLATFTGYYICK